MKASAAPAGVRLRLDRRLGRGLASAVLVLALAAAAVEGLARVLPPGTGWPFPSRLPSLPVLDRKLATLDGADAVECILSGGTSVYRGLDPRAVSRGYDRRAGQPLRCFNLAVPGATAADVAEVLELATVRRRDGVIVIAVTLLAAREEPGVLLDERAQQEPWLGLRRGQVTLDGWLIDRSAAYRRVLGARKAFVSSLWGTGDQARRERMEERLLRDTRADGFLPHDAALAPVAGEAATAGLLAVGSLAPLEAALGELGSGRVAVLVMPVHPRASEGLGVDGALLDREREGLARRVREAGAIFLAPPGEMLAEPRNWQDLEHLSATGVDRLGEWLGEALAEAVARGALLRSRPARPS